MLDSHNRWRILSIASCPDIDTAWDDAPSLRNYCPRRRCMQVAGGRIFLLIIRDSADACYHRTPIASPEMHKGDLMIHRHVLWTAILAMWLLLFISATPATAQESFYQGKTVRVIVGGS